MGCTTVADNGFFSVTKLSCRAEVADRAILRPLDQRSWNESFFLGRPMVV